MQGNRILCLQHLEQILLIQCSTAALGGAPSAAWFLSQEIERTMAYNRAVLRGGAGSDPAVIRAQRHVQHPLDASCTAPMSTDRVGNRGRARRPAAAGGASRVYGSAVGNAFGIDHATGGSPQPASLRVQLRAYLRRSQQPGVTCCNASVFTRDRSVMGMAAPAPGSGVRVAEGSSASVLAVRLMFLHGHHILATLLHQLLGERRLTAQRIDR